MTKFFKTFLKKTFFKQKIALQSKNVIALNLYIGTNVLVYERWLVLNVWYTAGWFNAFAITYSRYLCM